jgi:hypothetical protein
LSTAAVLLLLASPAWANAGIPMLALTWPAQWIAFVPIVLIETAVVAAALRTPYLSKLWPVVQANLLSTLVGVPVAWLVMLLVQGGAALVVFGLLPESLRDADWVYFIVFPFISAWIGGSHSWEIELAFMVLAVPFCVASVLVEERFLRRLVPEAETATLRRALWRGNVLTYSLLCLSVALLWFWFKPGGPGAT